MLYSNLARKETLETHVSGANGFVSDTILATVNVIGATCDLANHYVNVVRGSNGTVHAFQVVKYDGTFPANLTNVNIAYYYMP